MAILNLGRGSTIDAENNGNLSVHIPGLPGISITGPGPQVNPNFSIQNFIHNLSQHNETARTDKFDVHLIPPAAVANYIGLSPKTIGLGLSLQCETSELPGRDIQMVDYVTHAFIRRVPHMNQYGQASFTFICTGDFWEKKFFDGWLDYMIPAQTGLVNYPMDANNNRNYETDINLQQYDMAGNQIYQATLIDATPVSMSPLNQSWDNDSIHRLIVNFQFRKWTTSKMSFNQATTFSSPNQQILPNAVSGIISTVASAPSSVTGDLRKLVSGG